MDILVVDDERLIVQGIVKHLEKMADINLRVNGVYSAKEALEAMEFCRPDLLITDIRMPDMDGLELIAQSRKQGFCDTFIILTAHEVFEYARQAVDNKVLCYLVKPVDWSILEKHIRALTVADTAKVDVAKKLEQLQPLFEHVDRKDLSHALMRITKYIHANYVKSVSLTQLAIHSGLSENYICILFRKELGITFLDYVYELRIRRAIELLLTEPERTIQDISRTVGYSNERQFFRVFHDRLGMSPQQFRRCDDDAFRIATTKQSAHENI
ncbi:response regulator transcription factor [Clostridia bacterium]|nr:response regulator transcription factor [Clostridia bacterium]